MPACIWHIDINRSMETAGIRAATWVVGKALGPLAGGVLEAWGASSMLGFNMEALKMQLLYAQAMLNNVRGREIHNPALGELLDKLRQLAYGAEDVLDELDYFRIQDDFDDTYHAAAHAAGCVQDLILNSQHTARACVNKLKLPTCSRAATRDPDEQQDGVKQGCFSCICSLPPSPTNQVGLEVDRGCMLKVASSARDAAHSVGKHFPCYSFPSVHGDDPNTGMVESSNIPRNGQRFHGGAWLSSNAQKMNHVVQPPKLNFDRVKMSKKLRDIVQQLKPVCAMVSTILTLDLLGSSRTLGQETAMNRTQTTPEIIEPKLYGRDSQIKVVVDEVIKSECRELTVLPIVGPGGIGKTTFTQHIYEQMKSHFQVPIWICVSFDFNANRLAREIVRNIPEVNNEIGNCSDEELINQRIKGKRVLLVLDDVWTHHEHEWKKLLALFRKEGANGNMVIVTTRIPEVANTVKTTKCSLELERLSHEDIMYFFEECIFGDHKPWVEHLELAEVGSKIVDRLKGSPLAAKTVGRLLRNKLTLDHWTNVLESKEWESQTDENDIMPALKLSYDYLHFHLQQCFSICGLFPEDYEFGSKELVHFWIGLDILCSYDQKRKRIEDVGLCYLNDLVNHGFFKMIKREGGHPYYIIHDLLHELAVKVSSYECLSIYSSNVRYIQIPQSVRHLSIIIDNTDVKDKMSFEDYNGNLSALDKRLKVVNLRTIMLFGHYHGSFAKTFGGLFREATALRVIFLSEASYNLEHILHNFSKLVHLRYLSIKSLDYWNVCLPSALFRLYHLEVLDLQGVRYFGSSTRDMSNLVKLHHFLVPENMFHLHSSIFGVGKLKLFQEFKEFRVGKESNGFELSQLGQLTEIGGSLGIYNLENIQTKEEEKELKLIHKNHIRELVLEWDVKRSNTDLLLEENVLGSLVPHSSLQSLSIRGHGGIRATSFAVSGQLRGPPQRNRKRSLQLLPVSPHRRSYFCTWREKLLSRVSQRASSHPAPPRSRTRTTASSSHPPPPPPPIPHLRLLLPSPTSAAPRSSRTQTALPSPTSAAARPAPAAGRRPQPRPDPAAGRRPQPRPAPVLLQPPTSWTAAAFVPRLLLPCLLLLPLSPPHRSHRPGRRNWPGTPEIELAAHFFTASGRTSEELLPSAKLQKKSPRCSLLLPTVAYFYRNPETRFCISRNLKEVALNCPSWLCTNLTVKCLTSLCLDGVSWNNLPPLGEMWMVNDLGDEYEGCSISPPMFHNLKVLQLSNISRLTKWVGNGPCPLFSHLERLFITDCSELMELPFSHPTCCQAQREEKMAWFPRLQNLVIRNCLKLASLPPIPWRTHAPCSGQIKRAGSGIESLAYPPHGSKEGLEIEGTGGQGDLLWNGLNFSNLTYLKELCVRKCPPLPLDELELLVSLKKIEIYYSSSVLPPVQRAGHGMYRFPVEDLSIIRCDASGEQLSLLLSFLPNLSHLVIIGCNNIIELGVAEHVETISGEQQQHTARGDEEIASSPGLLLLPPHLQELSISDCDRISLLSKPPHDDQEAGEGRGGGLQRLHSLRFLNVGSCPEFLSSYSSPSSSFFPFPTCLQQLTLFCVKHMETLQVLSNLTSLTHLTLIGLEGSRDEGLWPLLAHGSITELILYYIPDFFAGSNPSWPLDKEMSSHSSKLLDLSTSHNTRFLAAPVCSLFSSTLARLVLRFENKVEPLTKEQEEALQLLTSLQELRFMWGDKLQRLPSCLDKLINLRILEIDGCWSIQSLPSLPSSLQELDISDCRALKSLPSGLPSSLEILNIWDCNAIKSLPKDGLPSSVRELDVHVGNSEELKRACHKLIGTIPIVRV